MMMNTSNLIFAMLIMAICSVVVNGFQQQRVQFPMTIRSNTTPRTSTAVYGIFDKMVKNMESGYAGGEESPYAKIKEKDKQKEVNQKKRNPRELYCYGAAIILRIFTASSLPLRSE